MIKFRLNDEDLSFELEILYLYDCTFNIAINIEAQKMIQFPIKR